MLATWRVKEVPTCSEFLGKRGNGFFLFFQNMGRLELSLCEKKGGTSVVSGVPRSFM